MDRALYLAMSGGVETMNAQTIHANNLANVNTTGFRADFEQARAMQVYGEHYPSRVYAMTENPGTRFTPGSMIQTGRNLDVAIKGKGFLTVYDSKGQEAYTRDGNLQINAAGQLVTGTGLPVAGVDGPIFLPPLQSLTITSDGSISIIPQGGAANQVAVIGQLKLVNPDPDNLRKGEDGLIHSKDGQVFNQDVNTQVASGFVEGSNVNAVEEMTHIMDLSRRFEMNIKMMNTIREDSAASSRILQRA
ncbi:Flagellar basal-body rod protein FlgF [Marinomonas spartinae]|uniref:Flagellar basal-body rod protein FlgF n=1 Tax=Marinomonas spartinae TaxID=1792290 RepID=A0A1A8T874_9GAMM|nr:flagellar basal-body rod protein FlgF [Marinomonas spartinae]SBS28070.1 Flagellar basal-body rod protein FlgF [Marinomonas spartinae]SBS28606.1 Flagellar basal-body rod protein FlgF [Marinomonas spartinae]